MFFFYHCVFKILRSKGALAVQQRHYVSSTPNRHPSPMARRAHHATRAARWTKAGTARAGTSTVGQPTVCRAPRGAPVTETSAIGVHRCCRLTLVVLQDDPLARSIIHKIAKQKNGSIWYENDRALVKKSTTLRRKLGLWRENGRKR